MPDLKEIFISLTKSDSEIARGVEKAVREILGIEVPIHYSTSREIGAAIKHGEKWFDWLSDRVRNCDFALLLLTPVSVRKPWVLWETGALFGVATANGGEGRRKIRPLVYSIGESNIPSPIRDMGVQFRRGDRENDMRLFFSELLDEYRELIPTKQLLGVEGRLDRGLKAYLQSVNIVLRRASLLELIDQYLNVDFSELAERVKRKNSLANEMADLVIASNINRRELIEFDDVEEFSQGLILALVSVSSIAPERDDAALLIKIGKDIDKLHVKFKFVSAVATLVERVELSKKTVIALEDIIDSFAYGADKALLNRIAISKNTLGLYKNGR
jgi:TIR domain-containing protein